jgi:predicted DNA-binding transcriptional regulator AlpA
MSATSNQEILSEREVSNWLGISEPTLFRHRRNGTGPRFIRLSARRIAYRRSAVEEWLGGCERRTLGSVPSLASGQRSAQPAETSSRECDLPTGLASHDGLATSERGGVS